MMKKCCIAAVIMVMLILSGVSDIATAKGRRILDIPILKYTETSPIWWEVAERFERNAEIRTFRPGKEYANAPLQDTILIQVDIINETSVRLKFAALGKGWTQGDWDGDGRDDLAITNQGFDLLVQHLDGSGTVTGS